MNPLYRIVSVLLALTWGSPATLAFELSGPTRIVDGDTLEIGSRPIRLHGIDAPETAQRCQLPKGVWDCGTEAANALAKLVDGHVVHCRGSAFDQYGRLIAVCSTEAEPDINASLVLQGLAWAYTKYSRDYVGQEDLARHKASGIWQSATQPPWEYRKRRWNTAVQIAPNGCPIKGNINRKGEHIYHTPWSRHYSKTKINLSSGERWFCDEKEAISAGWRPPIQ